MILNNGNKKLSRDLKRRRERMINMNGRRKTLKNKIKQTKKKQNFDKVKHLEIELVKIKYADKLDKFESALKEWIKIPLFD